MLHHFSFMIICQDHSNEYSQKNKKNSGLGGQFFSISFKEGDGSTNAFNWSDLNILSFICILILLVLFITFTPFLCVLFVCVSF